jgi:hypothetical protein
VVSCRGSGASCPDGRDGAKGFNSPFDLGHDDGTNAAVSVAYGKHHGSNASITLVDDGTNAAVSLVVTG